MDRVMTNFYGLRFTQFPEIGYELWRILEAHVGSGGALGAYRLHPVKYWCIDREASETFVDKLHNEIERELLVFKDPICFPCYYDVQKESYDLTKFGLDEVRATGKLVVPLSILAVFNLVKQSEPDAIPVPLIGPGDRFQYWNRIYKVYYVAYEVYYMNSGIPLYFGCYANLERDVSLDLPKKVITLPSVLKYENLSLEVPNLILR